MDRYWGHYIGDTDDSLTLLAYLAGKGKAEISLREIFGDFGAGTLRSGFRNTNPPLVYENADGWEMDIHMAIDLVSDLAALLLECRENGNVNLLELDDTLDMDNGRVCITAGPEDTALLCHILDDFAANPLAYDIAELMELEDLEEMAAIVGELRTDLARCQ